MKSIFFNLHCRYTTPCSITFPKVMKSHPKLNRIATFYALEKAYNTLQFSKNKKGNYRQRKFNCHLYLSDKTIHDVENEYKTFCFNYKEELLKDCLYSLLREIRHVRGDRSRLALDYNDHMEVVNFIRIHDKQLYNDLRKNGNTNEQIAYNHDARKLFDRIDHPILNIILGKCNPNNVNNFNYILKYYRDLYGPYFKQLMVSNTKFNRCIFKPQHIDYFFKRGLRNTYISCPPIFFKQAEKQGISNVSLVEFIKSMFKDLMWQDSYGGKAWEKIANGWLMLHDAKTIQDIPIAIDHLLDLQHNNGSVFTKLDSYNNVCLNSPNDFENCDCTFAVNNHWLSQFLDLKYNFSGIQIFLPFIKNNRTKKLCMKVFKSAGITQEKINKERKTNHQDIIEAGYKVGEVMMINSILNCSSENNSPKTYIRDMPSSMNNLSDYFSFDTADYIDISDLQLTSLPHIYCDSCVIIAKNNKITNLHNSIPNTLCEGTIYIDLTNNKISKIRAIDFFITYKKHIILDNNPLYADDVVRDFYSNIAIVPKNIDLKLSLLGCKFRRNTKKHRETILNQIKTLNEANISIIIDKLAPMRPTYLL
jgi:hypothetical protein